METTDLTRREWASQTIGAIAAALAAAQGELGAVKKDKTAQAGKYSYTYAELADVIEAVRPVFSKHGLAYFQSPAADGHRVTVTTVLAHESGEYFASALTLEAQASDPQSVGSAITYARRYGLLAAVGLAPEDDDGRQAATPADRPAQASQAPRGRQTGTISEAQAKRLFAIAKDAGQNLDDLKDYLRRQGWPSTLEIPRSAYDDVVDKVRAGTIRPGEAPPPDDFESAKDIGAAAFGLAPDE